ncbi:MAG: methyltransferase [Bdellovibrionota bacterium]
MRLWGRGFQKKGTFVLDGPYRYVQNPDELASVLLYVGAFFVLGVMWSWVFAFTLLLLAYFACVSGTYEDKLQQKVGHSFPRYRQRVKRWIPCFYPVVNRSKASFSWAKAFKSEYSTWLWLLGILIVAALRAWSILPLF